MAAASPQDDELVAINVTPLVDITLVLLIIFMVTASFVVRQTLEVDLPRPSPGGADVPGLINVVIDAEARLFFDGSPVNDAGLRAQLDAALAKDPATRAIITADPRLDYGRVMHLIDTVKGRGVERFALNLSATSNPAAPAAPASRPSGAPNSP